MDEMKEMGSDFVGDRVLIFDTTLRDGEQSPGASMALHEKVQIAELLDEMGVDIIEAGFPIASAGDFEAVSEISRRCRRSVICGLSRASEKDIDRAASALRHADRFRIHTFISTSPLHMRYKLQMDSESVYDAVLRSVRHARGYTDDVEWSCEDGTRSDRDFLCRCIEGAISSGATTINIPDTVGYTVPEEYYDLIRFLRDRVPNSDKAVFSVHCHDDLGMAVANSLSGVRAGARQVECTMNGLGERAGNASLEEIVMALRVRGDCLPFHTCIDSTYLVRASRLVSSASAFPVQYNKAIVGQNAFAHESGIHQDGMLKHSNTYEIMRPESVGFKETSLVMGKHSGRHAFRCKLEEMGYRLSDTALSDAFIRFKDLADKKKHVYDEDIEALIDDEMVRSSGFLKVLSLHVVAGTAGPQKARIGLEIDGVCREHACEGNGPVDAIFNAIDALYPHESRLQLYHVHAVTEGTDAQAEVSVRLERDGRSVTGRGVDADTLVASAKAYVASLNKFISLGSGSGAIGISTPVEYSSSAMD